MKKILVSVLAVVVIGGAWTWYDLSTKPANPRIQAGIQKIIQKEPSLRPMYTEAMSDGVLTLMEANAIAKKASDMKSR